MINSIRLDQAAQYSKKRIKSENVTLEKFITIDNILQNKTGITKAISLPPKGDTMPAFNSENILVGNIRPYLKKIWYATNDGGCSADVLVFEVNKEYHPKYVYYSLFRDDFFDHMMRGKKGTKMPRGDKNQILDFLIPDFGFSTQQKIASVLSSLDSKIELNNRINTELESMAKTLYDYWFVQFDFQDKKGKPYKTSGGKMVWNEELKREIPEGWEVKILKEIESNIITGKTPPTNNVEFYNGSVPFITIGDIRGNMHVIQTEMKLSTAGADSQKNKYIPKGSLCVTCIASPGLLGFATENSQTNQQINSIVIQNDENRTYLYYALNDYFKFAKGAKTGNTFANMNKGDFESIVLIYPSKELLIKFEKFATPIVEQILNHSIENQKLSELRDWLLPMLMNGQVKVGKG